MKQAGILLQDELFRRWTLEELCLWINAATSAVVLAKPSACSNTRILNLAQGTHQVISTVANAPTPLSLLSITRNILADGPPRVGGRAIRLVAQSIMDTQEPNWHSTAGRRFVKEVKHYIYDENNPLEFYCYPGNDGTGKVEAVVANNPAKLVATGDPKLIASYETDIGLPEPYSGPILDFVMHRAFTKDDLTGNAGRAQAHYAMFATAVGLKIQVERATSPNTTRAG